MKVVVGPYIGNIEQELFTFRPYVAWLHNALRSFYDSFIIATHEDNKFLYNNWPDINFIPVDKKYDDENSYQGMMNTKITNKDYLVLVKQFKNSIGEDVIHCPIRYTKYDNFIIPISKKIFTKINIESETTDNIVIISRYSDLNIIKKLCTAIPEAVEVNGKHSTKDIIETILSAKMVICPCGIWTILCNLHKIPVFSWGHDGLGMYKSGGVYNFNNDKSYIIHHTGKDITGLLAGIDYMRSGV